MQEQKMQIIIETDVDLDRWQIKEHSVQLMNWLKMAVVDKIDEYQGGVPMDYEGTMVQVRYQATPSKIIQPNANPLGIRTGINQAPQLRAISNKPAVVREIKPADLFDGLDDELQGPIKKGDPIKTEKSMSNMAINNMLGGVRIPSTTGPKFDDDPIKADGPSLIEMAMSKIPDPKLGNELLKEIAKTPVTKEESSED